MAAGDKIRQKIDSLILGPIESKQEEIKQLVESIRQNGGQSADVEKAVKLKNELDNIQSKGDQIDGIRGQVQSVLKAAESLKKTAIATREAAVIASSPLNPAGAAIGIVQEKLIEKFNEEIEDAKSAINGIKPALKNLTKSIKNLKKDLDDSIKKNEERKKSKQQRDAQLGRS